MGTLRIFGAVLITTLFVLSASCSSAARKPANHLSNPVATQDTWRFVVLSDIHFNKDADPKESIGEFVQVAIPQIVGMKPSFVILNGDSTRGNPDTKTSLSTVQAWWDNVALAMKPLLDAGIPVLLVAGNHDYYVKPQRDGYKNAWKHFEKAAEPLKIVGNAPLFYSFDFKNTHFSFILKDEPKVQKDVLDWLREDLSNSKSQMKFVFGHVPVLATADFAYKNQNRIPSISTARIHVRSLFNLLTDNNVTAFLGGHEHLFWDRILEDGNQRVRQITVGTAMGGIAPFKDDFSNKGKAYNFAPVKSLWNANCLPDGLCKMPYSGKHFRTDPKSHLQTDAKSFLLIEVGENLLEGYQAIPLTIRENRVIEPFYQD